MGQRSQFVASVQFSFVPFDSFTDTDSSNLCVVV